MGIDNQRGTIAFPSISTGAYGYPLEEAAPIALQTIYDFVQSNAQLKQVRFVLFDEQTLKIFINTLAALSKQHGDLRYE